MGVSPAVAVRYENDAAVSGGVIVARRAQAASAESLAPPEVEPEPEPEPEPEEPVHEPEAEPEPSAQWAPWA